MSHGIILLPVIKYSSTQLPDLKDAEAVQKFFLEEIQLGEELLAQGKSEVKHKFRPGNGTIYVALLSDL